MLKPILIAAATLAAAITASPVLAKPIAPTVRTISYADLDLTSAAGRTRLDRRIEAVIRDLCGDAQSVDLSRRRAVRECRVETRANVRLPGPIAAGLYGTR